MTIPVGALSVILLQSLSACLGLTNLRQVRRADSHSTGASKKLLNSLYLCMTASHGSVS